MSATKSTTKSTTLFDRVELAVSRNEGFKFDARELKAWHTVMVVANYQADVTLRMASQLGVALRANGLQAQFNQDGTADVVMATVGVDVEPTTTH